MMASSTSDPIAMAIPPRLMVFSEKPSALSVIIDTRSEIGIASSEMTVVRKLPRKTIRITITSTPPSINARSMLFTELSIKVACRNISVVTCTSGGRFSAISAIVRSSLSVSSSVPVAGCFVTERRTARMPSTEASPICGVLPPVRTSAMSATVIGVPSGESFTTLAAISSGEAVRTRPRTMYTLAFIFCAAASSSSRLTP